MKEQGDKKLTGQDVLSAITESFQNSESKRLASMATEISGDAVLHKQIGLQLLKYLEDCDFEHAGMALCAMTVLGMSQNAEIHQRLLRFAENHFGLVDIDSADSQNSICVSQGKRFFQNQVLIVNFCAAMLRVPDERSVQLVLRIAEESGDEKLSKVLNTCISDSRNIT